MTFILFCGTIELFGPRGPASDDSRLSSNLSKGVRIQMAKVLMLGVDDAAADRIGIALGSGRHDIDRRPVPASADDLPPADIVFACAGDKQYLPLLRGFRNEHPATPFVVVARLPETSEWLEALEAGATDYCSEKDSLRQFGWLVDSLLPLARAVAAV